MMIIIIVHQKAKQNHQLYLETLLIGIHPNFDMFKCGGKYILGLTECVNCLFTILDLNHSLIEKITLLQLKFQAEKVKERLFLFLQGLIVI